VTDAKKSCQHGMKSKRDRKKLKGEKKKIDDPARWLIKPRGQGQEGWEQKGRVEGGGTRPQPRGTFLTESVKKKQEKTVPGPTSPQVRQADQTQRTNVKGVHNEQEEKLNKRKKSMPIKKKGAPGNQTPYLKNTKGHRCAGQRELPEPPAENSWLSSSKTLTHTLPY